MLIDFSQKIKKLRETNGITQSALAKKVGISRNSVNSWEMGLSFPSVVNLIELTRIFHVSADYLLGISDDETVNVSALNDEQREIVYKLVKEFSK